MRATLKVRAGVMRKAGGNSALFINPGLKLCLKRRAMSTGDERVAEGALL